MRNTSQVSVLNQKALYARTATAALAAFLLYAFTNPTSLSFDPRRFSDLGATVC